MAEIAFEGIYADEPTEEWGLDGWTSKEIFNLLLTTERTGLVIDLNVQQCSMLAAALIEHVKEITETHW